MLSTKRSFGQYATPVKTVEYMVNVIKKYINPQKENVKILDPAVGDGVFVDTLLGNSFHPHSIYAYDIDPNINVNHSEVNFQCGDFLKFNETDFDAIIGNPPYKSKRHSSYIKENRKYLEEKYQEIGIQNTYSMFIYESIIKLKEGGVLCFIVQDSFLTNIYYQKFRNFLLENTLIKEIILAPRTLFHKKSADVRTAIITLIKCTGKDKQQQRMTNLMTLIDRLEEQCYESPPSSKIQKIKQQHFFSMDKKNFFINVPNKVLELILNESLTLNDVVKGGTGISTGKDAAFLKKADAITDKMAPYWVPFYKNGGAKDAWYYQPKHYIHEDWQTPSKLHKDFITRNTAFYFREGITCSSMGAGFTAAYLPKGCLFGVNANFFTENSEDLYYILGLLNSSLAKYLLRAIFNRTNMITAGYIKRLPYIEPNNELKAKMVCLSKFLVEQTQTNQEFDHTIYQGEVDKIIFQVYNIPQNEIEVILKFCNNMYESL